MTSIQASRLLISVFTLMIGISALAEKHSPKVSVQKKGKGGCGFAVSAGDLHGRDGLTIDEIQYVAKQPGGAQLLAKTDPNLDEDGLKVLSDSNKKPGVRIPLSGKDEKECGTMREVQSVLTKRSEKGDWKLDDEDEMSFALSGEKPTLDKWSEYGESKKRVRADGSSGATGSRAPANASR